MSNAFKPVNFDILLPPEPKKKEVTQPFDPEKLKLAIAQVKQEIENLSDGTSLYLNRAINFGAIGCPAQNQLKIFAAKPTMANFKGFIQLANQDFSARPANAMEAILLTALVGGVNAKTKV
jgi:hypothetical protein